MNTSWTTKPETKWQTVKTSQLCVKKISITPAVHSSGHNTVVVVKYMYKYTRNKEQYQIQMFNVLLLFFCKYNNMHFVSKRGNNNDDDTNNGTWSVYLQTFLLFFGFYLVESYNSFLFISKKKYDKLYIYIFKRKRRRMGTLCDENDDNRHKFLENITSHARNIIFVCSVPHSMRFFFLLCLIQYYFGMLLHVQVTFVLIVLKYVNNL